MSVEELTAPNHRTECLEKCSLNRGEICTAGKLNTFWDPQKRGFRQSSFTCTALLLYTQSPILGTQRYLNMT